MTRLAPIFCVVACCMISSSAFADAQQDADKLLADGQWQDAATAYTALLQNDNKSANNWMSLGTALEQLEQHTDARSAYEEAIAAGYAPSPHARLALSRVLAILNEKNLAPCTAEEYRHFDFWLGEWDVTSAGSAQATATNSITALHDGCVVLEQYVNGAFTGMSINFYDNSIGKWHQSWMSNAGGSVYLEGGLDANGAMVMSDADLPVSKVTGSISKTTWTPNADGSVRQLWEASSDGGKTWSVVFDGTYRKKRH